MAKPHTHFGKLLPDNEQAVIRIASALRAKIVSTPRNSIITIVVKIDPNGVVSRDTSMDSREFPLRDEE